MFQSYLTDGRQWIAYNFDNMTYHKEVAFSVPQSSVLDPMLFLNYINHLFKAFSNLAPIMFADNTNEFFQKKILKSCLY